MPLALAGSDGSAEVGSVAVFGLCVALAYLINWIVFVPSYAGRTEKYFDLTGSLTYLTVTAVALALSAGLDTRAWLAAAMVAIWAVRLGSFLFARIRRDGKDGRFDTMKHDFWQFLMTWTIQGLWVSLTVAAALAIITSSRREDLGAVGVIGLVVWLIGFVIEVLADRQKSEFRADPANDGRFISTGLWSWSRHPNYFGEITLWTGMAILAMPILSGWRLVVLISPVFVFLLLTRISGVPMLERRGGQAVGRRAGVRELHRQHLGAGAVASPGALSGSWVDPQNLPLSFFHSERGGTWSVVSQCSTTLPSATWKRS